MVLRAISTFKISNTRKVRGFDSRIYVQILWHTHFFPLSALIKSLLWVFRIASKFPYLNQKKMIFEKNHAYKCWQRKEPNMPCNLFIDSAVKITFLFCVRNIEGWNHSEHPVIAIFYQRYPNLHRFCTKTDVCTHSSKILTRPLSSLYVCT